MCHSIPFFFVCIPVYCHVSSQTFLFYVYHNVKLYMLLTFTCVRVFFGVRFPVLCLSCTRVRSQGRRYPGEKTFRLRRCNYFSHLFTPVCSVSISQLVFMFYSERQMEKHQLICADGQRLHSTLQYSLLRSVFYGLTEHSKQDVPTTSTKLIQLEEDTNFSIFCYSFVFLVQLPSLRLALFSIIYLVSITYF